MKILIPALIFASFAYLMGCAVVSGVWQTSFWLPPEAFLNRYWNDIEIHEYKDDHIDPALITYSIYYEVNTFHGMRPAGGILSIEHITCSATDHDAVMKNIRDICTKAKKSGDSLIQSK